MSLFKSLTDVLLKAAGQKSGLASIAFQNPALMNAVMGLLSKDSAVGGLPGLLAGFKSAGMGDIVESWLGQGANKPVTAPQVEQALGSNVVAQLAAQAKMAPSETSDVLARALPAMVDMLTPSGKAQSMDMSVVRAMLKGAMTRKS